MEGEITPPRRRRSYPSSSSYETTPSPAKKQKPASSKPLPSLNQTGHIDIANRAADVIAAGTYGCVIKDALICPKAITAATTDNIPRISKIVTDEAEIRSTLQACQLLEIIDPRQEFIIYPILEESCVVQSVIPANIIETCSKKYKDDIKTFEFKNTGSGTFTIFTMKQGIPLTKYMKQDNIDKQELYNKVKTCLENVTRIFHPKGYTHGDIQKHNLVVFTTGSAATVKLIDFSHFAAKKMDIAREINQITKTLKEIRKDLRIPDSAKPSRYYQETSSPSYRGVSRFSLLDASSSSPDRPKTGKRLAFNLASP